MMQEHLGLILFLSPTILLLAGYSLQQFYKGKFVHSVEDIKARFGDFPATGSRLPWREELQRIAKFHTVSLTAKQAREALAHIQELEQKLAEREL